LALAKSEWADIAPYFDDLAGRELSSDNIEGWLREWSRLEELVTEAAARAMIAYTVDTSDPEKEADHLRFSSEILPQMKSAVWRWRGSSWTPATRPRRWSRH